ncbi:MAG: ABC transporter ATP-binding protein [Saprospiraceae bacterium]|nr:ABC transporter ATP-binding protein [Saprospiraceae bacterium]
MYVFKLLFTFLRPYKSLVFLNIACNILVAIFTVVTIPTLAPFLQLIFGIQQTSPVSSSSSYLKTLNQFMANEMATSGREALLIKVCLFMVCVFFLKNLFRYLSMYFMAPVRTGIVRDIRGKTFSKLMDLPLSYYTDERKGDLIARMTSDAQEIEWSMIQMLESFFRAPFIVLGCLTYMITISPKLTLFVFILMLFTVGIIGGISRKLRAGSYLAQSKLGQVISMIEETLGGIKIIKAFTNENYIEQRFSQENNSYRSLTASVLRRKDLSSPLSEFLGVSIVCLLLWFGSRMVFGGEMDGGVFLSLIFAFYSIIDPSKSFAEAYFNTQKGLAAFSRIEEIWNAPVTVQDFENAETKTSFNSEISFENVSFQYKNAEYKALQNIDLVIPKGKIIALVGSSGSGKTTLTDMVLRFMDPTEGRILFDGIDIKNIKVTSLRSMITLVSQEPTLFNDSIRNNISFSSIEYTDEQIKKAAEAANAWEFIQASENQLDTNIGDRGMKLSGGQRQRLTIARAILKNPPILILDEATSALDSESEKLVQEALQRLMIGRTTIVIAHRLATIQHADIICVMKNGMIIEKGTHESLIKLAGEYAKFVSMQGLQ